MRKKVRPFCAIIFLSTLFVASIFSSLNVTSAYIWEQKETTLEEPPTRDTDALFTPTVWKPTWVDSDSNNIADTLDWEIANKSVGGTAKEYVNVIVILRSKPTVEDADAFVRLGGYLTTSPWTYALYGFGGQIPYDQISRFTLADVNVLLVEKEENCYANVAYAAKQIGARPYVWSTLGLRGDSNSSIAIVDTGIDDSHPDFSPGFGDKDFTKKIVGWNDQISPGTTSPYDDGGHGSHVAGLAAGNGFFSTDASGNAIATWGANLGRITSSGTYLISGMMVNKTGTITINVKWKNTGGGKLSAIRLFNGEKTLDTLSWTEVASTVTPNKNTWYTLTYELVSTPSGGYDKYQILMDLTAGGGNLYVVFTMSWPYSPPDDGFSAWTGIAPLTKLVGVKVLDYTGSGTDTDLLNAIDWIIANRIAYHIVIASMSLGFSAEVASVDTALINLVNSGVATIVSAGNKGVGSNYIYTLGSVDEVLTVAATNQFDNIARYSSQGGLSHSTGNTVKPDIAAPGGSFYAVPLFSADSNDGDADQGWSEVTSNDGAPMQGTSMSTPVAAGAASIVIQAMGGFSNWQWTRSQALQPKMILLMTATETYPNLRERDTGYSPTLERGGKDAHEGYGRLNLDAAVDTLLKTYQIGTTITDTLGRPPTISDISELGQKLAWARKVQLNTEGECNFTLTVPAGADFDLYLYNSTGTFYGEPSIVAKSTSATTGGREEIILTSPYNGTYYLVVKRATATTQGGSFTFESRFTPKHDIAVMAVEPSAASVYEGDTLSIAVTVKNRGLNTESFNVTAFYNATSIDMQRVSNLAASATTTLTFTWNTLGRTPGNYTVKAQASLVQNEYNITDNTCSFDGFVYIKIIGDVNGDGYVNTPDLEDLNRAYGSATGSVNWNPECDFNKDNKADIIDLFNLAKNYGKTV